MIHRLSARKTLCVATYIIKSQVRKSINFYLQGEGYMRNQHNKRPLATLVLACLAFGATAAHAQDDSMKSDFSSMQTSKYLFGDWGGTRTRLEDKGIKFDFGYGFDAAHNYSDGDRKIPPHTEQWKVGPPFDLHKLWGWNAALFNIVITDRIGHGIAAEAYIGNN